MTAIKKEHPDLIFVTGDTFERYDNRPQYEFERRPIKRLIINVIHYSNFLLTKLLHRDYRFLHETGVTLLDNADTAVTVRDFHFTLGGMSCWDYEEWLPTFLKKDGYKILLCHKPNQYTELLRDSGIDLTLSGHTHGGQVLIGKKGMGFFVPGQGLFGKYAHGSFFDGRLIVSAGCANTVACPRFFNPRELVMIEVT